MPKTTWNELISRFPSPHLVVAVLPDQAHASATAAKQLLVRLLKKLPTRGEFAVTISRRSGQPEILCGFGEGSDADLAARTADASAASVSEHSGVQHSFVLDEATERKLLTIAGPPQKRTQPRTTPNGRWQS